MDDRDGKVGFGVLSLEARKHPLDDRIELAYDLLQSVDEEEDPEYERLVMEEIKRRLRDIDEGRTELISGDQVFEELRAELAAMKNTPEIQEDTRSARSFDAIKHDALQLPDYERLDLAYAILRDLEDEGLCVNWEKPEVVGRSRESATAKNESI